MHTPGSRFRLATTQDADVLAALVQSAYRGEESRQGWTTEADLLEGERIGAAGIAGVIADPDRVVLVALDEQEQIMGCCELRRLSPQAAYLGMFAIRPARQAAGLGRAVLAEAETYVQQNWGVGELEMQVIGQRSDLIAWYERRGYSRTGQRRPFPYDILEPGQAARADLYFEVLAKPLDDPSRAI